MIARSRPIDFGSRGVRARFRARLALAEFGRHAECGAGRVCGMSFPHSLPLFLAASESDSRHLFVDVLAILATAAAVATIFRKLKLETIPGYLVAGALVGPHALGLVSDIKTVEQISSLAIILLMFGIGLMLETASAKRGMLSILAVGAVSTVVFILTIWPVGLLFGVSAPRALVVSMAFSMSSTAVLLRVLQQRRELRQMHGRICIGVSIVQDLMSVMVLAMLPLIAEWSGAKMPTIVSPETAQEMTRPMRVMLAVATSFGGIIAMIGFGRLFLPKILHFVSRADSAGGSNSGELVLITSIAMAIGAAMLTGRLGFSPEMGAFLAGFMLSFTPFRLQLAGQLAPLRDLLMAVFFTAVGLKIDPALLAHDWLRIGLGLLVLLTFKSALIAFSAWALGASASVAVLSGIYLAQAGEFSLVILSAADGFEIFGDAGPGSVIAIVVLSLVVSPLLVKPAHVLAARVGLWPTAQWVRNSIMNVAVHDANQDPHHEDTVAGRKAQHSATATEGSIAPGTVPGEGSTAAVASFGPVIIAGFGPVGRNLAERFAAIGVPITLIELNSTTVRKQSTLGRTIVYGDVTNPEVLESAGIAEAEAVIITIPDEDAMLRACSTVRRLAPKVFLAARTNYLSTGLKAKAAGADHVTVEEIATAEAMAKEILERLRARAASR